MGDAAEGAKGQGVGDVVEEAHAAGDFGDLVIVEPKPVGADALFVDEGMSLADVLDFGEPGLPAQEGEADAVFDDEAVVHHVGNVAYDLEAHVRRSDAVEIGGGADEVPGGLEVGGDGLFSNQLVNGGHGNGIAVVACFLTRFEL